MIQYKVVERINPTKRDEAPKYYAHPATPTPVSLSAIARRIEKRSTVSSADVKAVLDALQYEVMEDLKQGKSVRLGDLGSFRITLNGLGAETPEDFNTSYIKRVKVVFTPSSEMKKELDVDNVTFGRVNVAKEETEEEGAE